MTTQLIHANQLYLWTEAFGKKEDAAILLIQGSGAQGILWLTEFCEKLSSYGYYVIRYDHRDTGRSSHVDYNTFPYQLKDLMEDAKGILDTFDIKKAHIIGSSMGGYIAQLLGFYYRERILSLTLMMTSFLSFSLEHIFSENNTFALPLPTQSFKDSLLKIGPIQQNEEGIIHHMLSLWSAYNGNASSFNPIYWASLAKQWIRKTNNLSASYHHRLAVSASPLSREEILYNLRVPSLIIHGLLDPFFPIEHAYALQKVLPDSTLKIIETMGHLFHEVFIEEILEAVLCHLRKYR